MSDILSLVADPMASVSKSALATALAASNSGVEVIAPDKIEVLDDDFVSLSIAYNAFDLKDLDHHELQWRKSARLKDYLKGLPSEAEWIVFVNGEEVDPFKQGNRKIAKRDHIGLILVPQGGGSMKKIIMAAVAVAMVAVGALTGQMWLVYGGISMGLSLVSSILLMPKQPKSEGQDDSSYGIDGAKNSATENIPYPVIYGEFRTAGNFSDCYTENVGDDQYLYVRTVLNDGEMEGIYDIEINEQPISNFKLVETRFFNGKLDQGVNDWFPSSIVQINKSQKMTTEWITHSSGPIDRARFDISFPGGLTNVKKKDGSYGERSVKFEAQYRPRGAADWLALPLTSWSRAAAYTETTTPEGAVVNKLNTYTGVQAIRFSVEANALDANQYPLDVRVANLTANTERSVGQIRATDSQIRGYVFDEALNGSIAGPTDITPLVSDTFEVFDLDPAAEYEIRVYKGGGNLSSMFDALKPPVLVSRVDLVYGSSGQFTITDHRTRAIRRSVASVKLEHGEYDFRIRRVTPQEPEHDDWIDECYLTDIAEVNDTPVTLSGTANLSMRIKLNEQLNGIPQFTARGRGSLCQTYDFEGKPLGKVWTKNPAWQALDVMCGEERGAGVPLYRIDWPRWVEFAEWCEAEGLEFNGVFTTISNMGEATQQIMRCGHGVPVPFGTKISVAIDRPREPVHVFTQANIIKDSFQISYLPVSDRANEYEFNYYDKTDRNKQKTIRYVDPKAVAFNEIPRSAQVSFPGIDNHEQALRELWKAVYQNRLLIRTVQLDAWLDAINMTIGENALIQHDMMEWSNGGRLRDGSTLNQIVLDQKVELTQASNALVLFDAVRRTTSSVAQVVGNRIFITRPNGANLTNLELAAKRIIAGGKDFEIAKIENGSTYHTVHVTDTPTGVTAGSVAELWDTDVIEERGVTVVTDNADGTSTLTLDADLPMAPPALTNFAFGPVVTVRKPYTLTGISGNGLEKRTLSLVEYHEGVFGPPEIEIPVPVTQISDRAVGQVSALMMQYDSVVDPVRNTVGVRVFWNAGSILNYGGADVFMGVNGQEPTPLGSAVNVTEMHTTLNIGDTVVFKVVAYNNRGDRAAFYSAPMIGGTIDPTLLGLPEPTNFTMTQTGFDVAGSLEFNWVPPFDTTAIVGFEIAYRNEASNAWIGLAPVMEGPVSVSNQAPGDYIARIRSVGANGGYSDWVEITYTVAHPDINAAPVGLQLNGSTPADQPYGEFTGRDAVFTWTDALRDQVYFLDYEVRIYDEFMVPLRTDYTSTPDYVYSFDKNLIDGAGTPRRAINFEVRQRGRQGQLSPARAMFAQNPAPAFATAPVVEGALDGIAVRCTLPDDRDLEGIRVYASLDDPVVLDPAHLEYQGLSSAVTLRPIAAGAQHYVRVVPFDSFGDGTPSDQFVVLPTSVDDLFDTVPPNKVTNLTLSSNLAENDDNSVTAVLTASWSPVTADDINRYEVEIAQADGGFVGFQTGTTGYEWRGVVSGETYHVRVRGVDHMGNKGVWSDVASHTVKTDIIPPATPGAFTAVAAFRTAFLEWDSPADPDLKAVIVYENTTNDPDTAAVIATVAAVPSQHGTYTRAGLGTNQTRYYWIAAVDTSGNVSAKTVVKNVTTSGVDAVEILGTIATTQIADDSISTPKIKANAVTANNIAADQIQTNHIKAGAIVSSHIVVDALEGDRIKAGTLSAASLKVNTALPPSLLIGTSGVSIGDAANPAQVINGQATLIAPGKIQISGSTTLTSILYGGDNTKIDGGAIAANTITANKVEIGVRGITVKGLEFEHNKPAADQVSWTAGSITYVDEAGTLQTASITAGNTGTWTSGTILIYWVIGETVLRAATSPATANGPDRLVLATYGGDKNIVATYGRTVIDGAQIKTGSITADRMNVTNLSAITATIGTFQSAPSGQRVVISDSVIQVYDSAGTLRVRLGVW